MFAAENRLLDLASSLQLLSLEFLAGFSIQVHPLSIGIGDPSPVILNPPPHGSAIPGNIFLFFRHDFSSFLFNMYFSADTFFILKNHGSIKGAILGNAKGGEHSPPFVRFPSNYCAASYSPPSHSAKAPLKTPASCSGLLYFTFA